MKNLTLFVVLLIAATYTIYAQEWVNIRSERPSPVVTGLVESSADRSVIRFEIPGYFLHKVETPRGPAHYVTIGEATPLLEAGFPDLPKLTASVIIPDLAEMTVRIISSEYTDFHDVWIAPSKGNLLREVDPSTVPYTYGRIYQMDEFYPSALARLQSPYILRDHRGQMVMLCPFQYNAVTRTLRVFHSVVAEIERISDNGINPLIRNRELSHVDEEFSRIYEHHFLNYPSERYIPLADQGKMLIICYGAFLDEMEPFVQWKRMTGMPAEIVDVSTIGGAEQIKAYVADYYNTNDLTFLLLVGDAAQVPTRTYGTVAASDNSYGYITGSDSYPEVIVGRFSAESAAHVATQVERVINYEKTPSAGTDWYSKGIGIASSQGPGDDNEYDYQHMRNMRTDLLGYDYTACSELYDGSQGGEDASGNPTPAMVAEKVNAGAGIILYTGHGSTTSWSTSGFSNTNVDQLTNDGMLPFIFSVACFNGTFTSTTCFAEAWLRATDDDGDPAGAVASLMSTISQSWDPPMEAQDEMVDILTESIPENIKRTFGGLCMNGCMKMNDTYGSAGSKETDAWTCFGDPSLMVRTTLPQTMTVTHNPTLAVGATQFTVNCSVEDARVALIINDSILGTAPVQSGSATVTFDPLAEPDTITVVVTAYNYVPSISDALILALAGPYLAFESCDIDDSDGDQNGQLDYGEEVALNVSISNIGTGDAVGVTTLLTSSDPYVSISDGTEAYGSIEADSSKTVDGAFTIQVGTNVPDGHSIAFALQITGEERETWTGNFSLVAHAPILEAGTCTISDPAGNNNGKLDPGETVQLSVQVVNTGSSSAGGVQASLATTDAFVAVDQGEDDPGSIAAGDTVAATFQVTADGSAPLGHSALFTLEMTADLGISGDGSFSILIGQVPVLILDLDPNHSSGSKMKLALDDIGAEYEYVIVFPADLNLFSSVFVCLGVYSANHVLTADEGAVLAGYLENGGNLYMEGADTWYYDAETSVHEMFRINATADGSSDMASVAGQAGTSTEGMIFSYSGENNFMDHIEPVAPAVSVLRNQSPAYGCAVTNDAGTYRTVGASFEFGGLQDGSSPSTKTDLMTAYLDFFNISSIPNDLLLTNNTIETGEEECYQANDTIIVGGDGNPYIIQDGAGLTLVAGDKIRLKSGFYARPGSYFHAWIGDEGCNEPLKPAPIIAAESDQLNAEGMETERVTGLEPLAPEGSVKIYPNPTDGLLYIECQSSDPEQKNMVLFYDLKGRILFHQETKIPGKTELDLSIYPPGMYLMRLIFGDKTETVKIVKHL